MSLQVLKATNERGEPEMMKFIRYQMGVGASTDAGNDEGSIHQS